MTDISSFNSLNASESNDYRPSKVVAMFLVCFDMKLGYNLVWSKSTIPTFNFAGLDYKVLPSGIHESKESTVLVSTVFNNKTYYGISRFQQRVEDEEQIENNHINRNKVKMFSLGIICEAIDSSWKPNDFVQNGWEYIDILDSTLLSYINGDNKNFGLFEQLFLEIGNTLSPSKFNRTVENHLLNKFPALLETLGPLIFEIYKQSLIRKRILIFNNPISRTDFFSSGSFCYLISLLSVIPQDVQSLAKSQDDLFYSQTVYNVGLNDMGGSLFESPGYIGTTNDEVLMYQKNLFDVAIFLPSENNDNTLVLSSENVGNNLPDGGRRTKATLKDYKKFKLIYQEIFNEKYKRTTNLSTDDLSSINTTSSFMTYLKFDEDKFPEPSWWLSSATSPISWREYIWSAFTWFASAGQVDGDSTFQLDGPKNAVSGSQRFRLHQFVNVIGSFHKLTKKWFYLINSIIQEVYEESVSGSAANVSDEDAQFLTNQGCKISLELTYQDIIDMELDPYSASDLQFTKDFVLCYWGSIVDHVEIGIGIPGICC